MLEKIAGAGFEPATFGLLPLRPTRDGMAAGARLWHARTGRVPCTASSGAPADASGPTPLGHTHREGGTFQWVRETLINAMEAGAKRIEFGIEWQAVGSQRVYRRVIADDGKGMTPEELVEFFNAFGGGGNPSAVRPRTSEWGPRPHCCPGTLTG